MPETTEDRALVALRRMIVEGRLAPGARLTVATLARMLGVSPMPVRAALKLLEGEGLVASDPHRGARVRALAPADIGNLYRLRAAVLGLLIPDVARHLSDAELDALAAINARFETAARAGDTPAAMRANQEFHAALVAPARNPDAAAVLARTWAMVEALRLRLGFGPGRLARSAASHRALLRALRARDGARAASLAVASSNNAMADLLARALAAGAVQTPRHRGVAPPRSGRRAVARAKLPEAAPGA
jgi:DNA-binding GntR family transcriptional regulator